MGAVVAAEVTGAALVAAAVVTGAASVAAITGAASVAAITGAASVAAISVAAVSVVLKWAADLVGLLVRILPGGTAISVAREDSNATEVSITGVLAAVSVSCQVGVTASMTTGAATAIPITMVTAATRRPHTDVCRHASSRHRKDKPRIILAGLVP